MNSTTTALWRHPQANALDSQELARHAVLLERIKKIVQSHSFVRFATSMAAEDMVLVDAIATVQAPISLFTLETGRLHQETVAMVATTEQHYGLQIERVTPSEADVKSFIECFGLNGFYDSEAAKKACCGARKMLPLDKALRGAQAWITGQRREQAVTRGQLSFAESDSARGIAKYNPLFDWSEQDVWSYLLNRGVPINPLHQQGYPSIGCEPCTRPIKQNEDIRAGRWWWLQQENKECGLHVQ